MRVWHNRKIRAPFMLWHVQQVVSETSLRANHSIAECRGMGVCAQLVSDKLKLVMDLHMAACAELCVMT
jgi:hypothetical protein